MKKVYKSSKYKKWHDCRAEKIGKEHKRNKKYNPNKYPLYERVRNEFIRAPVLFAPTNLCLLTRPYSCLTFFEDLRKNRYITKIGMICFVQIDLSRVEVFDYSSICVLIAIFRDLKAKRIIVRGNYPTDKDCKKLIIESGLLTFMYDNGGKPFMKQEKSDLLFIEKGGGCLSRKDNRKISDTVKHTVQHLTGRDSHLPKLRTILLEICGNSLEWGGTKNKQWLLGVKYEEDKAIFTITDVGMGILKTLNRKFKAKFKDTFSFTSDDEILKGAFIRKYGSSTREVNRNKGLPAIKNGFDKGIIKNLKVLTNNVILHYDQEENSGVLKSNFFMGTLYQWEVTRETIQNAS